MGCDLIVAAEAVREDRIAVQDVTRRG